MTIAISDIDSLTRAKSHLSELVIEVEAGAEKIITKNGEPSAAFVSAARLAHYHWLKVTMFSSLVRNPFMGYFFSKRQLYSPKTQRIYEQLTARMVVARVTVSFREFLIPNYLILLAVTSPASQTVTDIYLLAIKHDKQLSFDYNN